MKSKSRVFGWFTLFARGSINLAKQGQFLVYFQVGWNSIIKNALLRTNADGAQAKETYSVAIKNNIYKWVGTVPRSKASSSEQAWHHNIEDPNECVLCKPVRAGGFATDRVEFLALLMQNINDCW